MAVIEHLLPDDKSIILLDGPMGTELERRGYRTTLPLWSAMANLESPELVCAIHKDYLSAGAQILTANTFRTTGYTLGKDNKASLATTLTQRAIALARRASEETGIDALVAASLAPLEDCYQPSLLPDEAIMINALDAQIAVLADGEADLILAETMINLPEARHIARRLSEAGLPFMMSFTTDNTTALLDGTTLEQAVEAIAPFGPEALLLNCRPPERMEAGLKVLLANFDGLVGVYANGPGHPDPETGWKQTKDAPGVYVSHAQRWLEQGVRIIGACCGATPETIDAVNRLIQNTEVDS